MMRGIYTTLHMDHGSISKDNKRELYKEWHYGCGIPRNLFSNHIDTFFLISALLIIAVL